ncbi:hypothetical protein Hanom_Chr16g01468181 [Helianthus anomalus]
MNLDYITNQSRTSCKSITNRCQIYEIETRYKYMLVEPYTDTSRHTSLSLFRHTHHISPEKTTTRRRRRPGNLCKHRTTPELFGYVSLRIRFIAPSLLSEPPPYRRITCTWPEVCRRRKAGPGKSLALVCNLLQSLGFNNTLVILYQETQRTLRLNDQENKNQARMDIRNPLSILIIVKCYVYLFGTMYPILRFNEIN